MVGRFVGTALALASISCGPVDRCLDQGGSFNYQIGECDLRHSQPGPSTPCLHDILGAWRVVGHRAPGVGALSSEEAAAWLGKRATYELSRVSFDGESCPGTAYISKVVTSEQFTESFHVSPAALGLSTSELCITEIACPASWVAPGSVLVHSGGTLITAWDGIFFELERE